MNSPDLNQRVTQKAERYKFGGASDEEKSELLKDVLAMANARRDGTGYLLLGFKERAPHPAEAVGLGAGRRPSRMSASGRKRTSVIWSAIGAEKSPSVGWGPRVTSHRIYKTDDAGLAQKGSIF